MAASRVQEKQMTERLQDRKVIVTGAASGIGRAIALCFAQEGAQVTLVDIDEPGLQRTAAQTSGHVAVADMADSAQVVAAVAEAARAMGGIDGVVNVAGIFRMMAFTELEESVWRRMHDVNLFGPAWLCRAALPHLRSAGGGTIVNIASLLALRPQVGSAAYAASKGGLISLTKALAREFAPEIRANVICPGIIDTPMLDGMMQSDRIGMTQALGGMLALGRLGQPDEVAAAALFLTSAESSYTTGATLTIDGGDSWY
jgi:NAD(P)-dependent dehydrogenase (short-subunit alcohol dehydrogenase family)